MLNSIKIGNFKAFAEAQSIPIRPLTLIYGANSSGKSSILQSLILARHAQETGNLDAHRTDVGGEAVDLGGFKQFVHRRDKSLSVNWTMELCDSTGSSRFSELSASLSKLTVSYAAGIALDHRSHPLPNTIPKIHTYEVFEEGGESLIRMSRRSDGKLRLDLLNHGSRVFRDIMNNIVRRSAIGLFTEFSSLEVNRFYGLIDKTSGEIGASVGKFLPEGIEKPGLIDIDYPLALKNLSQGSEDKNVVAAVRAYFQRAVDKLLSQIAQTIYEELGRFRYLGPLRSYPPRSLAFSQHHDPNWYSGGGFAWDIVRDNFRIRNLVNDWLSAPDRLQTPYELAVRDLVGIDELEKHLISALEGLEIAFEPDYDDSPEPTGVFPVIQDIEVESAKLCDHIRTSDIDKLIELILIDRRSNTIVSHRDIGVGVSQVLPVLVGAYAAQNQIIAIEQPEIHLHPALQADLADVFIQSALGEGKNRFLIETHSENLLLRVMRRIRQTHDGKLPDEVPKVTREDVCVLFVQPTGTSSVVRQMELDDEGRLLDAWPGGFFEEGFRERFE